HKMVIPPGSSPVSGELSTKQTLVQELGCPYRGSWPGDDTGEVAGVTRERVDDTDRHRWQEPGAYQVVPGIYRIPLPMPDGALRTVNVYVVEGDDGLTLIDAGWDMPQARAQLADALATLSYSVSD